MVSAPGVYVALQMRDPGVGIEPTVQERIFEPFFTTKGLGSGTGLVGVYGTLTDHRGAATVESVLGKGSVFTRYLPMSRRRAAARPHGGEPSTGAGAYRRWPPRLSAEALQHGVARGSPGPAAQAVNAFSVAVRLSSYYEVAHPLSCGGRLNAAPAPLGPSWTEGCTEGRQRGRLATAAGEALM